MSEKEERIWLEYDIPKPKGAVEATRCTTMTRQEAINRMAKAICLERHACISKGEMCGLCELWRNFSTHAEAALNALLEGK